MKKIFTLLVVAMLVFSFPMTAIAQANEINTAKEWALENGLPEELVNEADEAFLLQVYNENKNHDVDITASVSRLPSQRSSLQRDGQIDSSDLDFWIVAAKNKSGGYIQSVNCYTYFTWNPDITAMFYFTDAIIFEWDEAFTFDSDTANFQVKVYGETSSNPYITLNNFARSNDHAIGWFMDIRIDYGPPHGWGRMTLYPAVNPMPDGTTNILELSAEYAHATVGVSGINITSDRTGGLDFSGSFDYLADRETVTCGSY